MVLQVQSALPVQLVLLAQQAQLGPPVQLALRH
jgi:hypothetical protein